MCGILGIMAARGRSVSLDDGTVARMRDTMAHRGPDGAGLYRCGHIVLAHRRLAVVDTSDAAAQPMLSDDGRYSIVYNGELYNDAELRQELAREGASFRTRSDTETVLRALIHWGHAGLDRLRGMFALGFHDAKAGSLLLARDPLGIKPLYYRLRDAGASSELVFASETGAILAHPSIPARPDIVTISAYLTTIRTVMGDRTLFDGIRAVRPGQALYFEGTADGIDARNIGDRTARATSQPPDVRSAVQDSVTRHLRSDVPICCLLSGGLDSSIIAAIARRETGELHTYCSGSPEGDDFRFARLVSEHLGTSHAEAPVTRDLFKERWPRMVRLLGTPLSTPNEVAINEVARRMRADGRVVTLSGEGADELFGGYDIAIIDAAKFEGLLDREPERDARWLEASHGGEFQLLANAWAQPSLKPTLLSPGAWRAAEHDHGLIEFYKAEFEAAASERDDDNPLQPHLRFHRRINLAGLLQRLDTATMLESIEGRTPLADRVICDVAESLPIEHKFMPGVAACGLEASDTKRALRAAFTQNLPEQIVKRPKASFPLPFQEWVADHAEALKSSPFARDLFSEPALHAVAADPVRAWPLAWPMINLAYWGDRWWR